MKSYTVRVGLILGIVAFLVFLGKASEARFEDVTEAAGVGNVLYGTGLAWGDYDGDGDPDLYVCNWGGGGANNALYRNNGDGTFTDVASEAGVLRSIKNQTTSAAWGDYDGDGNLDLYVTDWEGQDWLYRNNGDGTFSNEAEVNVHSQGNEMAVMWGDYDGDGDLDLYLCKFYFDNALYRNNGDGTFTDVAPAAGVADKRDSEDATWVDTDGDEDLDLYVINREQENTLYRNQGDGTFEEVSCEAGVRNREIGKAGRWADYDGDGDLDLFLANIGANVLYRNENGTFTDVASQAGVRDTKPGWVSYDVAWGDYDGDGDPDLYVASGADSRGGEINFLYSNNGDGTFSVASGQMPAAPDFSTACAWADYDGDGDLDLYVVNYGRNVLYRNMRVEDLSE
ncbi:MAG: VCBS repeat-containing protein [Candidatus Latescibacteria bacterium]|nr:VCBS repeat-containing protein [Candidatus Latescibacterota bacterium]